ncbi:LysE family translocator [Caballeronia sp. dw_276]|uniref:LysE family translocator n=1 Tax=Caballeronia sp. dw_276 TaxID=2719795 RepID=UPI001BD1CEE9
MNPEMPAGAWIAFATATLAATGSPGPNALLMVRNTSRYGLSSAAFTLSGNLSARIAMATGIMLGLSALLSASPLLLIVLRAAGAAYLIYLGIKAFVVRRKPGTLPQPAASARKRRMALFLEASAVSAANPNTLGFFAAVIPGLVDVRSALLPQLGTLLAIDAAVVVLVMSVYAVATHLLHRKICAHDRMLLIKRCGGAVLIIVGVTMLPLK